MLFNSNTPNAFIPAELKVDGCPELEVLPLTILFMSYGVRDGIPITGTAPYYPDLSTFRENDDHRIMTYRNRWSSNDYIAIVYHKDNGSYEGKKWVNNEEVFESFGKDWKTFFIHLTGMGLSKGEGCEFEERPDLKRAIKKSDDAPEPLEEAEVYFTKIPRKP